MPLHLDDPSGETVADGVAFVINGAQIWFYAPETGFLLLGPPGVFAATTTLHVLPRGTSLVYPDEQPLPADVLLRSADTGVSLTNGVAQYYPRGDYSGGSGGYDNSWYTRFGTVRNLGYYGVTCPWVHPVWGLIAAGNIRNAGAGDKRFWYSGIARYYPDTPQPVGGPLPIPSWGPLNRAATATDPANLWYNSSLFGDVFTLSLYRGEIVAGGNIFAASGADTFPAPGDTRLHNVGGRFTPYLTGGAANNASGIALWKNGTEWDNLGGGTPYLGDTYGGIPQPGDPPPGGYGTLRNRMHVVTALAGGVPYHGGSPWSPFY